MKINNLLTLAVGSVWLLTACVQFAENQLYIETEQEEQAFYASS